MGAFAFPLQAELCGEANMACATFFKIRQSTLAMRAILGNVVGAKRQIVCEDTIP